MLCKQAKIIPSFENSSPANEMLKDMLLSFSEILAWTLEWVFIMVSFYSDVELMHKLGK